MTETETGLANMTGDSEKHTVTETSNPVTVHGDGCGDEKQPTDNVSETLSNGVQDDIEICQNGNIVTESDLPPCIIAQSQNESIPDELQPDLLLTSDRNTDQSELSDLETNSVPQNTEPVEICNEMHSQPLSDNSELSASSETSKEEIMETNEETTEEKDERDGWIYILGHDKLKKKATEEGAGFSSRPKTGDIVTVSYSASLEDGTVVDKHERKTFNLGEQEVIQALDLCIALMELNEVCLLFTDPKYAYGDKGSDPDIPADASLTYTVELLVVEQAPDYTTMPVGMRAGQADQKRQRGNELYSRSDFSAAINCYTKALKILDDSHESHSASIDELQSLVDTRIKCHNNLAAAQLKMEAWDAAIKSSEEVLKVQPDNVKALFRKGKCLANKGEIETAIVSLKKALKLEPETKIIHQELSRLMSQQKRQDESDRAMYQKMLGTDKIQTKSKRKEQSSSWFWYVGGAVTAAALSAGIAAYRYLHV